MTQDAPKSGVDAQVDNVDNLVKVEEQDTPKETEKGNSEGGLSLEQLLQAGVHFGHKASRWNPKMAPYIFTTRNKFHIIDLEKTREKIRQAQEFTADIIKSGGTVLFVGTKRQSKDIVKKYAIECGMPYVSERWLGGTLTNFKTIQRSIRKLKDLEELLGSEKIKNYTKKEQLMKEREFKKGMILFEGIRKLKKLPEAVFVVDTDDEKIAVREARSTGVKVIGLTDTNSDPSQIDYLIPANDDATKAIDLITRCMAESIKQGKQAETVVAVKQPEKEAEKQPEKAGVNTST